MPSTEERTEVFREYLLTEVYVAGIFRRPFNPAQYPQVHTSQFDVIPKITPCKWRLIVDIYSPDGVSACE